RQLYPPLPPEEARRPVGTRQKPTPFRLEKRDVTAKNVQVGTVLEVPGNLDYTKFKKRAEGNLAVRVTDEPEVVDGNVIIPTTAGAYIVPLKHYVVRLRMYENS